MKRMLIFSSAIFLLIFSLPIMDGKTAEDNAAQEPKSGLVTLDFENADIRDVIKVIALASGTNMVIGEGVKAQVTISLKDVAWERALDIILRTYNFTYKKEENLIRIMTFEKVKQEQRDIPLITKIIYLNFADVSDLQGSLTKMLSDRGAIEIDARTNSMLITDIPEKVEEAEKIAKQLDTRTPQVLIEAMLVDVKLTKDDELGINWQIFDYFAGDDNQSGDSPSSGGERDFLRMPSSMSSDITEGIGASWVQRLGQYRIDGLIKAWARDKKATVLASPKIMTLDNQTARIEIKSQVDYTQYSESDQGSITATTQFKGLVTGLEVTPHITKEGFISMNVKPKQEFVEGRVSGQPQIGSRSAETNVLVKDGETIVIGGMRKVEEDTTIQKIPILGDIPLLGKFFRSEDKNKVNTELVMFVTPRIVIHPALTQEEKDRFKMLDQEREGFLKEWEKEKQKRLKKSKRQARVSEEGLELPPLPVRKQDLEQDLQEDTSYIYSW